MKPSSRKSLVLIAFFTAFTGAPYLVMGQKNLDVCRLTTDKRSIGYGTGIYEIGKFPIDDIEGTTRKRFRFETDGLVFSVDIEVEYGDFKDVEKGKPTRIIYSMLVKLANDNTSASMVRPIEAGSKYRYKWGTSYISYDFVFGDIKQHFQLMCSDGLSKDGLQRGESRRLKKRGS